MFRSQIVPFAAFFVALLLHMQAAFAQVQTPALQGQVRDARARIGAPATRLLPADGVSALAFSPDGRTIYITETPNDTIAIVDAASMKQLGCLKAKAPDFILVSPDGGKLYVATSGPGAIDGSNCISVVDTASLQVLSTIRLANFIVGMALSPNGQYLYAARQAIGGGPSVVWVIDTRSGSVVRTVKLPGIPYALTTDGRAGGQVYIWMQLDVNKYAAYSLPDDRTAARLQKVYANAGNGSGISHLCASPDGMYLVAQGTDQEGNGSLLIINAQQGQAVGSGEYVGRPRSTWHGFPLAIGNSGEIYYLTGSKEIATSNCNLAAAESHGKLSHTSLVKQTSRLVKQLSLGAVGQAIALSPDGQRLYAALPGRLLCLGTSDGIIQGQCELLVEPPAGPNR